MLFNSVEYILCFLPVVFGLYFFFNKFKLYNFSLLFLLFASLFFYSTYKIEYAYIIVFSILFNYSLSLVFKRKKIINKFVLFFGILGNILLLAGFKYFNFVAEVLKTQLHFPINTIEILVPLGISFFTIQQISYIVDCYKGKIKEYSFINYALFICFFPQFLAGPIVRHQEIIPQFQNIKNRIINQENIFKGLFLITLGLLKKVLIADNFVDFINCVDSNGLFHNFGLSWFFAFAKVAQGYFDFSGYCDIALGSALLFNIKLPENFNSPFKAKNIIDYWNRWHMTLVRFLKDYVFYPLGGVQKNMVKTFFNLIVVGGVYGCWKAVSPVNIIYGLINALLIYFNLLWKKLILKLNFKISGFIANLITFITILLTTPFIAQTNLKSSFTLLKTMLEFNLDSISQWHLNKTIIEFLPGKIFEDASLSIILLVFSFYMMFISKNSSELADKYVEANNTFYTVILALVLTICTLSITRYQEFVYFNFN